MEENMQIFQGTERDLKEKFKLSALAIVGVGVLRSKNILLTEPVLELCKDGGVLEPLLKNSLLLSSLRDPHEFEKLQCVYDPQRQFPLRVLDQGSHRLLLLEAELMAEAGWQQKEPALEGNTELAVAPTEMHLQGLENLFSKEEIDCLKMTIATAVNPTEKIEAIRKMALAQVSLGEKSILFLHALGSPQLEIRSEAAQALRQIGFNRELSEAITTLSTGDEKQRCYAIVAMSKLFNMANELEKGAILQILLTTLRDQNYHGCVMAMFEALGKIITDIPSSAAQMFERIMVTTVEVLVSHLDEFLDSTTTLFAQLANKDQKQVMAFLWNEIQKSELRRLRAFLLLLLSNTDIPEEKKDDLAKKIAYELGLGDELDTIYLRLTGKIILFEEKAVYALLERFIVTIRVTERIQIIKLLDKIFLEKKASPDVKNRALKTYITYYPSAGDALKKIMLECSLLQDSEVDECLKTEFAQESLVDVHKEKLDPFDHLVKAALCRMGKPSLDAMLRAIKKPLHVKQALKAADILGEVMLFLPRESTENAEKIKTFCTRQVKSKPEYSGELFKILGKIAVSPCANKKITKEITEYLLEHLCKTGYPYEVLEGLGWAVSGEHSMAKDKVSICHLFMALMDKRLPENLSRQNEDKKFEFNIKITAYTELLPVLISGFTRLAKSYSTSHSLRKAIIIYLLKKWEDIVNYKIIWGPKSIMDFAQSLSEISLHKDVSAHDKVAIAQSLYKKVDIFTITEMLATIFSQQTIAELQELALKTSEKLLEFAHNKDYGNPEDREVIMKCIGRLLESEKLAKSHKESEEMREKLLYTLFDGLQEQVFGARNILFRLQDSPHISKRLKQEIQKRLPQYLPSAYATG
jgi:hypothetical protein